MRKVHIHDIKPVGIRSYGVSRWLSLKGHVGLEDDSVCVNTKEADIAIFLSDDTNKYVNEDLLEALTGVNGADWKRLIRLQEAIQRNVIDYIRAIGELDDERMVAGSTMATRVLFDEEDLAERMHQNGDVAQAMHDLIAAIANETDTFDLAKEMAHDQHQINTNKNTRNKQ